MCIPTKSYQVHVCLPFRSLTPGQRLPMNNEDRLALPHRSAIILPAKLADVFQETAIS